MGLFNHENANRAVDAQGAPVQNAIRRIYSKGHVGTAPVYLDPDLTIMRSSDMKSDASGYFDLCYLQTGAYRVEIESPSGKLMYRADDIHIGSNLRDQELDEYATLEQLTADVLLTYEQCTGRYQVRPGQKLLVGSNATQYQVMPETESAPQLVTAGGVRFCETGTRYSSEARFQQAVARGEGFSAGALVLAGGAVYSFRDDGNTEIAGLTGWAKILDEQTSSDARQARGKTDLLTVSQSVNLDVIPALVAGSNTYASVAAGLAGTTDGEAFFVSTGPGLQVYRNDTGAGTFVGWHGDVLFDDVASLSASMDALPEGLIVRTRQEGYAYKVAAPGASDHHLTTAGGGKLYVLPLNESYPVDALGVVNSGEDCGAEVAALMEAANAADMPVRFGPGTYTLGSSFPDIAIGRGKTMRWNGERGSRLYFTNNAGVAPEEVFPTTLSADAARHDRHIAVADATGMEVGDLLYIDTDTPVESGWNYDKQCVRRIAAIDGTMIFLDQPLDFFFTTAEATTVTCYSCASIHVQGLQFEMASAVQFSFRRLCDSSMRDGKVIGPVAGWQSGWSDGVKTVSCDRFVYDGVNFEKLRYPPQITTGSRYVQVKNAVVKDIRHLDANSWAQDVLYEDITGISTDGIIQCHPAIRPVWRRVSDSVTRGGLYGVDLRGLGEIVEDCIVHHSNDGFNFGNTNAPLLTSDYHDMAGEFTRRITRLRAPHTKIRAGAEGLFFVEQSDVGGLDESQYTLPHTRIAVDDLTRVRDRESDDFDGTGSNNFDVTMMRGLRANVEKVTQYRTRTARASVTGVTQANPAVVTTLYDHRLRTGDTVQFSDVNGMTELNGNTFAVTVVDATSFSLDSTDSTGFTAYASGGTVVLQTPNNTITGATQASPCVITAASHGYSDGDVIWINGVGGMTELNAGYYKVASSTTDTFEITDLDDVGIDATGYAAYILGGVVTLQEAVDTVDAATKPQCGIADQLLLRSRIWTGNSNGQRYYRFPVKYRSFGGGSVDQKTRWGVLRVIATSNMGRSIAEFAFNYSARSGTLMIAENHSVIPNSLCIVDLVHAERHFIDEVYDEGAALWADQSGSRHYLTFDIKVDVNRTSRFLYDVFVEVDEQRQGNF